MSFTISAPLERAVGVAEDVCCLSNEVHRQCLALYIAHPDDLVWARRGRYSLRGAAFLLGSTAPVSADWLLGGQFATPRKSVNLWVLARMTGIGATPTLAHQT